jgi:hypothetical protein
MKLALVERIFGVGRISPSIEVALIDKNGKYRGRAKESEESKSKDSRA